MLFTGMLIGAEEALRIGLVDEIAESAGPIEAMIAASSPHSTGAMKRFVRRATVRSRRIAAAGRRRCADRPANCSNLSNWTVIPNPGDPDL